MLGRASKLFGNLKHPNLELLRIGGSLNLPTPPYIRNLRPPDLSVESVNIDNFDNMPMNQQISGEESPSLDNGSRNGVNIHSIPIPRFPTISSQNIFKPKSEDIKSSPTPNIAYKVEKHEPVVSSEPTTTRNQGVKTNSTKENHKHKIELYTSIGVCIGITLVIVLLFAFLIKRRRVGSNKNEDPEKILGLVDDTNYKGEATSDYYSSHSESLNCCSYNELLEKFVENSKFDRNLSFYFKKKCGQSAAEYSRKEFCSAFKSVRPFCSGQFQYSKGRIRKNKSANLFSILNGEPIWNNTLLKQTMHLRTTPMQSSILNSHSLLFSRVSNDLQESGIGISPRSSESTSAAAIINSNGTISQNLNSSLYF